MKRTRRRLIRRLLRDMIFLTLAVLFLQILGLRLLQPRFKEQRINNLEALPLVAKPVLTLHPESRLLPAGPYLSKDSLHTVELIRRPDAIEAVFLTEQLEATHRLLLPPNIDFSSLISGDLDNDGLLELIYARYWPIESVPSSLGASPDSLRLCARSADGSEITLQSFPAGRFSPAGGQRDQYLLAARLYFPRDGHDTITALGANHLAVFLNLTWSDVRESRLLLYNRDLPPRLIRSIPLATMPETGFWQTMPTGKETFTFGSSSQLSGAIMPVRIEGGNGGHRESVLAYDRPTIMQVKGDGTIRWVRSFPPSTGRVIPYEAGRDSLLAVQVQKERHPNGGAQVSVHLLERRGGQVRAFHEHPGMHFTQLTTPFSSRALPIGVIGLADSLNFLQGRHIDDYTQLSLPTQTIRLYPKSPYLMVGEERVFPVRMDASTILLMTPAGAVVGRIEGVLESSQLLAFESEEDARAFLTVRFPDDQVRLMELISNPNPYWRFFPYRKLAFLLLLPYLLILFLYAGVRIRQERRYARRRLALAYRRLQTRFRWRSRELAEVNQVLTRQADERRRVLLELQQQREHLDAIFNSVEDGMVSVDRHGVIIRANRAFGTIFNQDPEMLAGVVLSLLFPAQREGIQRIIDQAIDSETNGVQTKLDLSSLSQDEVKVVSLRGISLQPAHENSTHEILLIFRDETRLVRLEHHVLGRYRFHNLTGQSDLMVGIYSMIESIAPSDATVLITGESGTGKELVARAIHLQSPRSSGPFITVHCAALTETLLESELFGHVRGAFTGATRDKIGYFQKANRGTLFLDEFGEVSPSVQVKLLRVLNDKVIERVGDTTPIEVDVRILIATNRNLGEEMRKGRFREDLYYRVNVLTIEMPPLRDRREDIPLLVTDLLRTIGEQSGRQVEAISEDVMDLFMTYPWPGNIRELRNCLERAAIVCRGDAIKMEHLPPELEEYPRSQTPRGVEADSETAEITPEPGEYEQIMAALQSQGWVIAKAARKLGWARQTLYRKMIKLGIGRPSE